MDAVVVFLEEDDCATAGEWGVVEAGSFWLL